MTPHQRALKTVNDWYDNQEAKRPELVSMVTTAILANNNNELETHRRKIADLEDKLEQSNAHRKLLVMDYKAIQEKLAVVATKKKEISRHNQKLLAANFEQSQLLTQIFSRVSAGAYHGFDYTNVVAMIKTDILGYINHVKKTETAGDTTECFTPKVPEEFWQE